MSVKIECSSCQDCFEVDEIKFSTETILEIDDPIELEDFAIESEVRFDYPSCEKVQYLSDCNLF